MMMIGNRAIDIESSDAAPLSMYSYTNDFHDLSQAHFLLTL